MGFKAANPDWLPTDPSGSLFLSRIVEGGAAQFPNSSNGRNQSPNNNHSFGGGVQGFTPVNSTLALRSQFYEEAFSRSVSLARNQTNLSSSGNKRGRSSVYNERNNPSSSSNNDSPNLGRRLDKVDENGDPKDEEGIVDDDQEEEEEDLDLSSYQDGEVRGGRPQIVLENERRRRKRFGIEEDDQIEEALQREREELEWENHERNAGVAALFKGIGRAPGQRW